MTAENRPATGAEALEMLKQGNARYVDSLTSTDEYMQRRPELVKDQNPLASTC
jgi:carbonic anhydrase